MVFWGATRVKTFFFAKLAKLFFAVFLLGSAFCVKAFASIYSVPKVVHVISTEHFDFIFPKEAQEVAVYLADCAEAIFENATEAFDLQKMKRALKIPCAISCDSQVLSAAYSPSPYNRILIFTARGERDFSTTNSLKSAFERVVMEAVAANVRTPFWQQLDDAFHFSGLQPLTLLNIPAAFFSGVLDEKVYEADNADDSRVWGAISDGRGLALLIQAKAEGAILPLRDWTGSRDIYPGHLGQVALCAFTAYIQSRWGVQKFLDFWKMAGGLSYFRLTTGIFKKVYGLSFKTAWGDFVSSIPSVPYKSFGESIFKTDGTSTYSNLIAFEDGIIYVDTTKRNIYRYSGGKRRALWWGSGIRSLHLLNESKRLLITYETKKANKNLSCYHSFTIDPKSRLLKAATVKRDFNFPLPPKAQVDSVTPLSNGKTLWAYYIDGECILSIVGENKKLECSYKLEALASAFKRAKVGDKDAISFSYHEKTASYNPFAYQKAGEAITFERVGYVFIEGDGLGEVFLQSEDVETGISNAVINGAALFFVHSGARTQVIKKGELKDLAFKKGVIKKLESTLGEGGFAKEGGAKSFILVADKKIPDKNGEQITKVADAKAQSANSKESTSDYSAKSNEVANYRSGRGGGAPGASEENGKAGSDIEVLSAQEANGKESKSRSSAKSEEVAKSKKQKKQKMVAGYRIKGYNPLKYMTHFSFVPFFPISALGVTEHTTAPGLGLTVQTSRDLIDVIDLKASFCWSFVDTTQDTFALDNNFTTALILSSNFLPFDLTLAGLFKFTAEGSYDFQAMVGASYDFLMGMEMHSLTIAVKFFYDYTTKYKDYEAEEEIELKNWPSLSDAYMTRQIYSSLEYNCIHQAGRSTFEKRGVRAKIAVINIHDPQKAHKKEDYVDQLTMMVDFEFSVPALLPLHNTGNAIVCLPFDFLAKLYGEEDSAFQSTLEVLLFGWEVQRAIPGLPLFVKRTGLSAGYEFDLKYNMLINASTDFKNIETFRNVFLNAHYEDKFYIDLKAELSPNLGKFVNKNATVGARFFFGIHKWDFGVRVMFNMKL